MNLSDYPRVIGALHLLPSDVSAHPQAQPLNKIIDHALLHAQIAYDGGVRAFYIQDVNDTPVAPTIQPTTVTNLIAVGQALRKALPDAVLGVCLMQHGGKEPLEICHAMGGQFVRIKVYNGVMIKAEGILSGCAYDAIQTRHKLGAQDISIFADLYDRTGMPLAPLPLAEQARQAVAFGRADGLVLTGHSPEGSIQMLDEVSQAKLGVPLAVGGGVSPASLKYFVPRAQHFIVHAAFSRKGLPAQDGIPVDWDINAVKDVMAAAR
jgi:uncharacterized protein